MARLIRITCDVNDDWESHSNIEIKFAEQIRTAHVRPICDIQCGQGVRHEDFDLIVQLFEDTLRTALGRTIGVQDTLL